MVCKTIPVYNLHHFERNLFIWQKNKRIPYVFHECVVIAQGRIALGLMSVMLNSIKAVVTFCCSGFILWLKSTRFKQEYKRLGFSCEDGRFPHAFFSTGSSWSHGFTALTNKELNRLKATSMRATQLTMKNFASMLPHLQFHNWLWCMFECA